MQGVSGYDILGRCPRFLRHFAYESVDCESVEGVNCEAKRHK